MKTIIYKRKLAPSFITVNIGFNIPNHKEEGLYDITKPPMKKIAYLSGKITGEPNLGKYKFEHAEAILIFNGYTVLNPHRLPADHDKSWISYMKVCIIALVGADCVFVLDNWTKSRGAVREVFVAMFLGLPIYSAKTLQPVKMSLWTKLKMILNLI